MYGDILRGLSAIHGTNSLDPDFAVRLIPAARKLHSEYQQAVACADYTTRDAKSVYMLRYFPYYTRLIGRILAAHPECAPDWNEDVDMALFGPGPGPELISTTEFLREIGFPVSSLTARLYDLDPSWETYRQAITDVLLSRSLGDLDMNLVYEPLNFSNPEAIAPQVLRYINRCELISFQNCINEVGFYHQEAVVRNVSTLFAGLRRGSSMILVGCDRNYVSANSTVSRIAQGVSHLAQEIADGVDTFPASEVDRHLPEPILNSLLHRSFVDGLTLRRDIEFAYVIAKRA